jgi:uncharacterized protein (DUF1330 family)
MSFIEPTADQIKEFMRLPEDGPVVMVNLLKFKPDGGAELYAKYAAATTKCLLAVGGRLIYRGRYRIPVIGDEDWDEILLVEYPSIAAFFDMQRNEDYRAVVPLRTEALSDSRLWATKQE